MPERPAISELRVGAKLGAAFLAVVLLTAILGEVSAASSEQSAGVGQMGEAVTQMDQTTQQNGALVRRWPRRRSGFYRLRGGEWAAKHRHQPLRTHTGVVFPLLLGCGRVASGRWSFMPAWLFCQPQFAGLVS